MLGTTQKTWFKAALLVATEPCIVVCTGSPWIGSGGVSWGVHSTEREELAELFEDNALTEADPSVGDQHFCAGDDGTNSRYDTGSSDPRPAVLCYSAWDQGFTSNSDTWSGGIHKDSEQRYGSIDFVRDGDEITATFRASEGDGEVEKEPFGFSTVF